MSFSVTFKAGDGGSINPSGTKTYTTLTKQDITATANSGWRFNLWSGDYVDAGTIHIGDGIAANYQSASISPRLGDLGIGPTEIQANFTQAYYVNLSVNNSTYGSASKSNYSGTGPWGNIPLYDPNSTIVLTATPNTGGYTFSHWEVSGGTIISGTTTTQTITVKISTNTSALAVFGDKTRIISASASPSVGGTITGAGTYNYGATCTLVATANAGYTFKNWTESGTAVSTSASYSFTVSSSRTLVANFTVNTYTVTLDKQGGSGGTNSVTATYGSAMPSATAPTRSYTVTYNYNGGTGSVSSNTATYTFGGYYDATSGGTQYYTAAMASAKNWDKTSNTTLYARWTSASVTLPSASYTGYTFDGWYTAASGGTKVGNASASYTPTASITVYAHWTIISYLIKFDKNGGSGTQSTGSKNYGQPYTLPNCTFTAPQTYQEFKQWRLNSASGTAYAAGTEYLTNAAATFYAEWQNKSYTITWKNWDGTTLKTDSVVYGGTPSYTGSTPTRSATAQYTYTFSGWSPAIATVTGNATYTAQYTSTVNRYTISASVNPASSGTVSGTGSYEYGSTPTLTATASTGYSFTNWTLNGVVKSTSASYKIDAVDGARSYVANFTANTYTLTVSSNNTSYGTVSGGGDYSYNTQATLTASAKTGYRFNGWYEGGNLLDTANPLRFYVKSSRTITGNFSGYTLTVSAGTGGTVSGGGSYASGSSRTITATANSGYRFDCWERGGTVVSGAGASYTFTMPAEDATYTAYFVKTYTVSVSASPSGSGTVSGGGTYDTGASVTVTASANSGYTFSKWTESSQQQSTSTSYTFTISANRILVANFTANTYTVTLDKQSGSGGTASVTATYGSAMPSATMPTRTGYTFQGYYGSTGGGGTKYYNANGTSANNWNQASAKTIYAYWKANTYTVTLNANNGSGGTASVTATYDSAMPSANMPTRTGYTFAGYYDTSATSGGTQYYTSNGASARTWNKTTDTILYAHWTIRTYTVTTSSSPSAGGTTSGGGTYNYGATCTLTATPATGYNFSSWKQGSTAVSSVSTYSFTVTGSGTYSFTAYFTLKQYTLTVNSNNTTYGTVSGGGTYNHGATASLVATPKTGYTFVGWYKGSTQLSTQTTYSYTVNEAVTIEGRFTGISITATAGTGGTVSPSGTNIYASGTSVTLTATANSKYEFAYWLEGSTQYGQNPYTFTASSNRTLTAIFNATRTVSITVNPTGYGTVTGAKDYVLNSNATVTATPTTSADITYAFVNWTKGGTSVSTNTSYTFQVTADTALVANFQITAYTIYFNKNGGDGSQNPGTKTPGVAYTVPTKAGTLIAPTGKHFTGWNTKADGTGTTYQPGDSYTTDASITFYAQWAWDTYTVSYNGNGNSGGTVPSNQTKTYGVNLTLSSNLLTKTSTIADGYLTSFSSQGGSSSPASITQRNTTAYTHDGWATSSSGAKAYNLGGSYTSNEASTMYAHWNAVETKGSITLPSPGAKPGYYFSGWYTSSSGGSRIGGVNDSYTPSEARTLYAQWAPETYEVTFDKNGGSGGTNSVNATYTQPMPTIEPPEKTGYDFLGYYGNGKYYYNSDGTSANNWDLTDQAELTARWSAVQVTITFDKNGGTGGTNAADIYYDTIDVNYPEITLPSKDGYDFLGYYDSNNVQYINNEGEGVKTWDKPDDTTLIAKWQIVTYTATFIPNNGTWASGSGTKTQSYKITDVLVVPSTISRTGYGFLGWKVTSAEGNWVQNTVYNNTPQTKITGAVGQYGNVTFTAQWSINTYTISISADPAIGGVIEKSPDKPEYDYGEEVIIEATPNAGYNWVNWTKNGVQVTTNLDYDITVQASETYVAHFQPKTIRVTLDANGGEFDPGEQTYVDIEYNSPVGTEVQLPHTPQRGGYQFDGYSDGTQKYIDITEVSTTGVLAHKFDKTSNTTFYAIWIPIQYTATYDPGIGHWTGTTSSDDRYETYTVEDLIEGVGSVDKEGYDFRTWVVTAVDQNDCSWHVGDLINYLAGNWGNVTFTAQFDIKTFQITGTPDPSGWGTVTGSGTYNWNAFATLTATAASGYKFKQWNEGGTKVSESASYSFAVTQARTLVAVFEKDSFNISTSIVPTGAGTISGGGEHEYASQVTLTKTQNTGYVFYKWRSNHTGSSVDYTTSNLQFSMPAFNVSVSAHYKCTITLLTDGSGTVTGAGDYVSGSQRTVKATPGTGWGFDGWYENGTKVYSNAEYTFTLTQPRTLTAKFIANSHTVTLLCVPDGAGDLSGGGAKQYGTTVTIEEDAELNYTFTKWVIDWTGHVEEQTTSTASFQMPDDDVTATAYYDCWVLIQPNNSQWGTTTGSGDYTPGDTCTATATPALGYRFVNWTNTSLQPVSTNPTYTFTVTNAIELTANFERIKNNITYTIKPYHDDGQVSQSKSNPVESGTSVTLTPVPSTGYEFVSWSNISGLEVADPFYTHPWTFVMPENPISMDVNFRPQTFQIQASANPAGKGTVSGTGSLQYGTTASLTATPITNFEFVNWTENGSVVSTSNPYQFTVNQDRTLVANFKTVSWIFKWDGTQWVAIIPKVWNGSSWEDRMPKKWTGTEWI